MLKYIVSIGCLFFILNANAETIERRFDELLLNSDYIVYGEVRAISYLDDYSGEASIYIHESFKGMLNGEKVYFKWSKKGTDQKLTKALERHIFFLKKHDGYFEGAVYGVSVWDVVFHYENEDSSVVLPMPLLDMPIGLFSKNGELDCNLYRDCVKPKITLKTFREFIKPSVIYKKKQLSKEDET